jgi:acetyl esterase
MKVLERYTVRSAVRMPRMLGERLFGAPPTNDLGVSLDYQTHMMLRLADYVGQPQLHELGTEGARAEYERTNLMCNLPVCKLREIEDRRIDGPHGSIPVRIYRPSHAPGLPACVYYHGGGFVIGGLDGYDGLCSALAERGRCVVVSVDYRLAPEHPFPAPIDDSLAAYRWVRDHADDLGIDAERIAVAGDSAGGNLATVVCQQLVEAGEVPPAYQLLIYPTTDQIGEYASHHHFGEGFLLTGAMMDWFTRTYLSGYSDLDDPRVSPLRFDRLDKLPPAKVITAGFDPLRDEGIAYATRLAEAGVTTVHRSFDRLIHSFITMGGLLDSAGHAVADIAHGLRDALHRA